MHMMFEDLLSLVAQFAIGLATFQYILIYSLPLFYLSAYVIWPLEFTYCGYAVGWRVCG